ncbi:MAG TPA: pantetheine-phosphate adenylyltransferase [Bdellovibrionales bacterium]|nr:pantetheine-phosphate adenylyltransferase [Bdellovibrionales bacterium]
MIKAIYPGSFDPITLGHLDIIRRIQPLFSELAVVVANSQRKQYLFSLEERVQLIRANLHPDVRIDKTDGLIVDYAREKGAKVIVRGLRAVSDFEYELSMAGANKSLSDDIETMIVFTRPEFGFVASTIVKEVAHHGGDLTKMVPENVADALAEKIKGKV